MKSAEIVLPFRFVGLLIVGTVSPKRLSINRKMVLFFVKWCFSFSAYSGKCIHFAMQLCLKTFCYYDFVNKESHPCRLGMFLESVHVVMFGELSELFLVPVHS